MQAEIITIGDEILIGQIVDTNSAWMAQQLNAIGIAVKQITSVTDQQEAIVKAMEGAAGRADLVLITGGLGPTKDDVTKQSLARYFVTGLRRDPNVLRHVETIFARLNRPMLEMNRRQADVLDNADILFNRTGTAPGMWVEQSGKPFIMLPGVPFEMKHLMETQVLPRLAKLPGRMPILHHTLLTGGIGESFLAEKLEEVEHNLPPHLHLAYLPKPGLVRLRLSASGADADALESVVRGVIGDIKIRIPEYVIAEGDISLPEALLWEMDRQQFTLSTAESCTGGYIAYLLTGVPGSSSVYTGGAVTYSNQLKTALLGVRTETLRIHGAVSEQTVTEMAQGARENFGTDYAVAVSGIAGPGGGTEEKPVGTVWIAVADKTTVHTRCFHFGELRSVNIERAANAALIMLFRAVKAHAAI